MQTDPERELSQAQRATLLLAEEARVALWRRFSKKPGWRTPNPKEDITSGEGKQNDC